MKRSAITLAAMAALVLALAAPAAAHTIRVTPPGHGGEQVETHRGGPHQWSHDFFGAGWVGGPVGLPGQGAGLVGGGPGGDMPMTPAHVSGLNTACEALGAESGNGVVDIRGPGPSCPHGQ
jgi:hypothetical protein